MHSSNHEAFLARIAKANTPEDREALSRSLDRLYANGIFTAEELSEFDLMIADRLVEAGDAPAMKTSDRHHKITPLHTVE